MKNPESRAGAVDIELVIAFLNLNIDAPHTRNPWPHDPKNKHTLERMKRFQKTVRKEIESALTAPRKAALERLVLKLEDAAAPSLSLDAPGRGDHKTVLDFG